MGVSVVATVCVCTYVRGCVGKDLFKSDLISHMWLELKFDGWAERGRVHFHEALAVTTGIQTVHCVLNDVQALVTRRLQVIFSRKVGPQSSVQRGMISQITTLYRKKERREMLPIKDVGLLSLTKTKLKPFPLLVIK